MEYLKHRTIGNKNPKGKSKIYFCATQSDFNEYFESIVYEIFAIYDCCIFYLDDCNLDISEYEDDLKSMHLFVIPITTKFLTTDNHALKELKFAISNNIPVLPIMKETNLEETFNSICGDIQFLDPKQQNDSGLTYNEKLKKFLSSVILDDELIEKIKAAFDAYVFLSYRKKDRKHAEKLMRLIHKNEFCRDVAIWYDEFLVPGENFNDAIKDALLNSELFVLAVTPNLVNEDNYIIDIEYPLAIEGRKPILPVELVETDKEKVNKIFNNIPFIINANDEVSLSEGLLNNIKKIAIETNNSKEHNYFIGLAYLLGIDVEIDAERALDLITSSADEGLIEAIDKLIEMYHKGIGVPKSYQKALEWLGKKIVILEHDLQENESKENANILFENYLLKGDLYFEILKNKSALICYQKALELSEKYEIDDQFLIDIYDKLALIYSRELKYSLAIECYEKNYQLCQKKYGEKSDSKAINVLSSSYYKLAKAHRLQGDFDETINYCLKALDLKKQLLKEQSNEDLEIEIAKITRTLGSVYLSKNDVYNAEIYLERAFEMIYPFVFKPNGHEYANDVCQTTFSLIHLYSYNRRNDLCEIYSDFCHRLVSSAGEKFIDFNALCLDIDALYYIGRCHYLKKDKEKAIGFYKEAIELGEKLLKLSNTLGVKQRLFNCYSGLLRCVDDVDEGIKYYILNKRIIESLDEENNIDIMNMKCIHYSSYADFLYRRKRFDKALELYYKELEIREEIIKICDTVGTVRYKGVIYGKIAKCYFQKYEDDKAFDFYHKKYILSKELLSRSNNVEQMLDFSYSCYDLIRFVDIPEKIKYLKEGIVETKKLSKILRTEAVFKDLTVFYTKLIKIYNSLNDIENETNCRKELEENQLIVDKFKENKEKIELVHSFDFTIRLQRLQNFNKNIISNMQYLIFLLLDIKDYRLLELNKEVSSVFSRMADYYKQLGDLESHQRYKECSYYVINEPSNPTLKEAIIDIYLYCDERIIDEYYKEGTVEKALGELGRSIDLICTYRDDLENKKKLSKYYHYLYEYYIQIEDGMNIALQYKMKETENNKEIFEKFHEKT